MLAIATPAVICVPFSAVDSGSGSGSGNLAPYSASGAPDYAPYYYEDLYEELLQPTNCTPVLPLPIGAIAESVRQTDAVVVEVVGITETAVSLL